MFFFFGSGGTSSEMIGEGYAIDCPRCHNVRPWPVARSENRASVFFIPVAKWGRKYWTYCPICSTSASLSSEEEARQVLATATQPLPELRDEIIRRASTGGGSF